MAVAGFAVYLELASYFPNRSGSEVVYLEQAYPRPKYFFPIAFAVQSVILSFSSSNAIGKRALGGYNGFLCELTRASQFSRGTCGGLLGRHRRIGR